MQVILNHATADVSNQFLRALWAEFRQTFGKCAWQFSPHRDGEKRKIRFGWMDIGSHLAGIEVYITYSKKGVIHTLFIDDARFLPQDKERIKSAVDRASARMAQPDSFTLAVRVTSRIASIAPYSGNHFRITVCGPKTNQITVTVRGYDSIDAKSEAQGLLHQILDVLSAFTNATFEFEAKQSADSAPADADADYHTDYEWIDGYPLVEKKLVLWREGIGFLDALISGTVPRDHPFLSASAHFHTAQKGWTEANLDAFVQVREVLLVSALEAATNLTPVEDATCGTCGQKVYSIRKRVIDLARKYTNELICNFIDDYYHRRSRFLHVGTLVADRSYGGTSVPLLDPSSPTGCRQQIAHPPSNLTEYVGFTLRQAFRSEVVGSFV